MNAMLKTLMRLEKIIPRILLLAFALIEAYRYAAWLLRQ
jgi:hypothetical protein